jgi:hypothetical protein
MSGEISASAIGDGFGCRQAIRDFPRRILDGTTEVSLAKPQRVGNKNIDDLLSGAWYQEQIARLGRGKPTLPSRKPVVALAIMLATMLRDRLIVRIPRLASRART